MRTFWRDLVYIGLFGALWALADSRLGPFLVHRDLVFYPAMQAAVGVMLALCLHLVVRRRGSILLTACVAVTLVMLYAGGIVFTTTGRILGAALWAEAALLVFRKQDRAGFVTAGALAVLWTLAQPLLFAGLFAPKGVVVLYRLDMVSAARLVRGLPLPSPALMLLLVLALALLGVAAGLLAWVIGSVVRYRLARASTEPGLAAGSPRAVGS